MADERTKEQVFDAEIQPLMDRVLTICKEHAIPAIAHFAIPTPDKPGLTVTSVLLSKDITVSTPPHVLQPMLLVAAVLRQKAVLLEMELPVGPTDSPSIMH